MYLWQKSPHKKTQNTDAFVVHYLIARELLVIELHMNHRVLMTTKKDSTKI